MFTGRWKFTLLRWRHISDVTKVGKRLETRLFCLPTVVFRYFSSSLSCWLSVSYLPLNRLDWPGAENQVTCLRDLNDKSGSANRHALTKHTIPSTACFIRQFRIISCRWSLARRRERSLVHASDWETNTLVLNKIYSYIVIINSSNKYREHKSNMLIWVLSIEKMTITYTFTMVAWEIIVESQCQKSKATYFLVNLSNSSLLSRFVRSCGSGRWILSPGDMSVA